MVSGIFLILSGISVETWLWLTPITANLTTSSAVWKDNVCGLGGTSEARHMMEAALGEFSKTSPNAVLGAPLCCATVTHTAVPGACGILIRILLSIKLVPHARKTPQDNMEVV